MTKGSKFLAFAAGVTTALAMTTGSAFSADTVKIVSAHKGNWSTASAEWAKRQGYFKKEGINAEIVWTHGGSDAQQAIISGAAQIALQTGTLGVLSAYAKGAPIRVIAAAMTGSGGLYWYVKANSPLKSFKDAAGKTMAYSRPGSSTNLVAAALSQHFGVNVKLVSAGGPAATLTQVMTGQVDIGWASPPLGLAKINSGEIRVLVKGDEAPAVQNQTIRVDAVNADWLKSHRDVAKRVMRALWKAHEYAYTKAGMEEYSKWAGIKLNLVKQVPEYITLKSHAFWPVKGLEQTMKEAIKYKRLKKPLTKAQIDDLIQVAYKPKM